MILDRIPSRDKLGACPTCMSLSVALFCLGLLVLGSGANINEPIVVMVGQLASLLFGIVVGFHAILFVARRGTLVARTPADHRASVKLSGCGCAGASK
jgi:hypothetical protein